MTKALAAKQAEVLAFMRSFHAENDNLPTMPVIARRFGWASANAAHEHVRALEKWGYIERVEGQTSYRFARSGAHAVAKKSGDQ